MQVSDSSAVEVYTVIVLYLAGIENSRKEYGMHSNHDLVVETFQYRRIQR